MRLLLIAALGWFISISADAAPPITAAAFSPDGNQVLIGSQAGLELRNWPGLELHSRLKIELSNIHDLAFSHAGDVLLIAGGAPGEDGVVEVWTWPDRVRLQQIKAHRDLVYRVAWSPDRGEFATAGADGICQVFDAKTGKQRVRYAGHSRAVLALAYLPDGQSIVSAGVDQTLQLWNSSTGEQLRTLDNHLAAVNDLAVRPGTKLSAPPVVVSVSDDRTVRLWQPTIGRLMRFAKLPSPPRCVAWSTDGLQIVVGCNDGRVRRIDPESVEVETIGQPLPGRIHQLLAAPHTQWLIGGDNGAWKSHPTGLRMADESFGAVEPFHD